MSYTPHPPDVKSSPFKRSAYKHRTSLLPEKTNSIDNEQQQKYHYTLEDFHNRATKCLLVNEAFKSDHSPRFDIIKKKHGVLLENGSKRYEWVESGAETTKIAVKSTRKRRGSAFDGKTFDEALVNAEFAIDRLIGPSQEISFIAKDVSEELEVTRKERILNAMRTTTKQSTSEISGSVSNQILHENLIAHDSRKINEENEQFRQEIIRRDVLYDTFHRWKLTAAHEAYCRLKFNRRNDICKYLIEKMLNRAAALLRRGFSQWRTTVMASPLAFQTKMVGNRRVLMCEGKIVQILG